MKIADSIKRARKQGMSDEQILEAIIKQNPSKGSSFNMAKERGMTATEILDKTIEQNQQEEKNVKQAPPIGEELPATPPKPTEESKLWVRIFITLGLVFFVSLSFTLVYRTLFVSQLEPIDPQIIRADVNIPVANYPIVKLYPERDAVKRLAVTMDEEYKMYLREIMREERGGEIVRLIVEDQKDERNVRISNLEDFFSAIDVTPPENFFDAIGLNNKNFTLLVYTVETPNGIGFITEFNEEEREKVEWNILKPWEETIEEDFSDFLSFLGAEIPVTRESLEAIDYYSGDRNFADEIRYREGTGNMGVYYSILRDRLVFATTMETIKTIIDRHYEL